LGYDANEIGTRKFGGTLTIDRYDTIAGAAGRRRRASACDRTETPKALA
jgi:hypothetical protein